MVILIKFPDDSSKIVDFLLLVKFWYCPVFYEPVSICFLETYHSRGIWNCFVRWGRLCMTLQGLMVFQYVFFMHKCWPCNTFPNLSTQLVWRNLFFERHLPSIQLSVLCKVMSFVYDPPGSYGFSIFPMHKCKLLCNTSLPASLPTQLVWRHLSKDHDIHEKCRLRWFFDICGGVVQCVTLWHIDA